MPRHQQRCGPDSELRLQDPWKGPPITVDVGDLTDYVGQPPFTSDRIYGRTPAGVVMGLAWTSMGGNALYIEAAMVESGDGKGGIRTTGVCHTFSVHPVAAVS